MKVLVTGATGFIGRALCEGLLREGHAVRALTRDLHAAQVRLPAAIHLFAWRPADTGLPCDAVAGADAVVHLAGETVAGRWNARKRQAIRASRVVSTLQLVSTIHELAAGERPRVLVCGSAAGFYGDRGEEILTESSPAGSGFLADVCREWEVAAMRSAEDGLRVVQLRTGLVLQPSGGALKTLLPLFHIGLGGPLGSGRQWWSWVSRDDLVGLIVHALGRPVHGPLNGVVPEPMRQRAFAEVLGRVLKRPVRVHAPALALRFALGAFASELLSSRRIVPRAAEASGYRFRHPDLTIALREMLGPAPREAVSG